MTAYRMIYIYGADMANRTRNKCLSIRLNDSEYRKVMEKMNKTRLTQREFVVSALLEYQIIVKVGGTELVRELKAIGNNINQIARKVNSGEIRDCTMQLVQIQQNLEELTERWQ